MPAEKERRFDLNIEKILEGWETCHAIREVIANALDEQILTNSKDVEISKDRKSVWHVRDFGSDTWGNRGHQKSPRILWLTALTLTRDFAYLDWLRSLYSFYPRFLDGYFADMDIGWMQAYP